jgi:hypothetical protein
MAYISKGNIVLNKSAQAAMKNEPIYSVGQTTLAAYVSTRMYDQESFTGVGGTGAKGHPIFVGTSMRSGFPQTFVDATVATNIVTTT